MTIYELITALAAFPADAKVVVPYWAQRCDVYGVTPCEIEGPVEQVFVLWRQG